MNSAVQKIRELEERASSLEMTGEEFRMHCVDIVSSLSLFLDQVGVAPGYPQSDKSLLKMIQGDSKLENLPLKNMLLRQIMGGIETGSGNFFGFIPGGGIPAAALADLISSISNRFSGLHHASPGAVAVENEVISWLTKLFYSNEQAWGSITSGGTSATLTALLCAKQKFKGSLKKAVVYMTDQAHHANSKVLRTIGIENQHHRFIKTDRDLKLDLNVLRECIDRDLSMGLEPFAIIANAGTTNFGLIDPIKEITDLAIRYGIWVHADAAYGGFFILTEAGRARLSGLSECDSITVDPHKGLFMPYGIGVVIVKEQSFLKKAMNPSAPYLEDALKSISESPIEYSFELTKHNRAPRLKLSLELYGESAFAAALEEKLLLADYFQDEMIKIDGIILGNRPELSICAFRLSTNEETNCLLENILKNGQFYLSSTTLDQVVWIRMCVLSFRTHLQHVEALVAFIREAMEREN